MYTLERAVLAALYYAEAVLCDVLKLHDDVVGMEWAQGN
jgi:hypothetical protein